MSNGVNPHMVHDIVLLLIPKGSGQGENLPPGVDLDHEKERRPVAVENRHLFLLKDGDHNGWCDGVEKGDV